MSATLERAIAIANWSSSEETTLRTSDAVIVASGLTFTGLLGCALVFLFVWSKDFESARAS